MSSRLRILLCTVSVFVACDGAPPPKTKPEPATEPVEIPATVATALPHTWTFDDAKTGSVPAGFRLAETGGAGSPATWEIVADPTAPTAPHVFGITQTVNAKATYNLALVEGIDVTNVDLQVLVKAGSGQLDRGGGPIWRVQDSDNYYIARYNPLEKNARFYVVSHGVRTALAKVELELDAEAWHSLRVVMEGSRMQLFIDDEPVLSANDSSISGPGTIGLWTKADAATFFDDLSIATP